MPLVENFLEYLKSERNKSDKTISSYRVGLRQFEEFFESLAENITWQTVSSDVVREWVINLLDERHLDANSVNARLSALRTFYHYLKRLGIENNNPMLRIESPKKKKVLPSFVREKDMDKLLDESEFSDDFEGKMERTVLMTLYLTGMRRAEMLALRDRDIDFCAKQIKVTGKRNKQRIIPFGEELENELRSYIALRNDTFANESPTLFVNRKGSPLNPASLTEVVKKNLSKVTSLKKRSPHVLRHTFATAMLNNHADLVSIQKILGHSNLHTTEIYTHLSFEELKEAYKNAHPRN